MRRLLLGALLLLALTLPYPEDASAMSGELCKHRGICRKVTTASCVAAAVTLDAAHKGGDITLSGNNLTASIPNTAGDEIVRATQSFSTGKIYIEGTTVAGTLAHPIPVGWVNGSETFGPSEYLGIGLNSFGLKADGQLVANGTFTFLDAASPGVGGTLGLAFDIPNLLVWETHDGVNWNTSLAGTQNPATGQGGFSLAGLVNAGPYFPALSIGNDTVTDTVTVNYGASSFSYTKPSGFSAPFVPCAGPTPQPPPVVVSFFVATAGSDGNDGLAPTTGGGHGPFLTLGQCQTAMRNSGSIKTCTIRGGTYNLGAGLSLTASDSGETWQYYTADGVCTAKIDGGSTGANSGVFDMFQVGTTNVTFIGLQFQNIQQSGIVFLGSDHGGVAVANGLAKYNCFTSFHNNGTNGGPVNVWGTQGVKILNNVCWNVEAECFNAANTTANDNWSGWDVENNFIANCDTVTTDMGCIYAWSGTGGATPGTLAWKNNYINNYGSSANFNKCLYLDDRVSGATLTQNICLGTGEFAVQVHGGINNVVDGNIFDMGGGTQEQHAIIWQGDGTTDMHGNTARSNILINHGASMFSRQWFNNGGVTTAPTISNNICFNPDSTTPTACSVANDYTDTAPHVENPLFTDSNWTFTLNPASPVFAQGFPGITGGWGYPGFQIPTITFNGQSITEPSYLQ